MVNLSITPHKIIEALQHIKTVYSLAGLIILSVSTVVIYVVRYPTASPLVVVVILTFEVGLFAVLILLAWKMQHAKPTQESSEPTLDRKNLSVELSIWENLAYCLEQIGFANLVREKRVPILQHDYHFSWAEYDSAQLVFLQLKPQEFTLPNLRQINSLIRLDLLNLASLDVAGYIIVCDACSLDVACLEYLGSLQETLKCLCLANYHLTRIRRKDDIAQTHLKAKLSPWVTR